MAKETLLQCNFLITQTKKKFKNIIEGAFYY